MEKKNLVILAIGIYVMISGIIGMLSFTQSTTIRMPDALTLMTVYMGLVTLVNVIAGFFLIKLRNWARLVVIAYGVLGSSLWTFELVAAVFTNPNFPLKDWMTNFGPVFVSLIQQLLIIYYLTRSKVKELFK